MKAIKPKLKQRTHLNSAIIIDEKDRYAYYDELDKVRAKFPSITSPGTMISIAHLPNENDLTEIERSRMRNRLALVPAEDYPAMTTLFLMRALKRSKKRSRNG